jgi:hypothetical protein
MSVVWITLILLVAFFVWAGWRLRSRDGSSGLDARTDRHRRTDGYDGSV